MDMKVPPEEVDAAIERALKALKRRIKEKGNRPYRSRHETYGIIAEEHFELLLAMQKNDGENYKDELVDIAVAAIFGLASHNVTYK